MKSQLYKILIAKQLLVDSVVFVLNFTMTVALGSNYKFTITILRISNILYNLQQHVIYNNFIIVTLLVEPVSLWIFLIKAVLFLCIFILYDYISGRQKYFDRFFFIMQVPKRCSMTF